MADFIEPIGRASGAAAPDDARARFHDPRGVEGWLLVLCLMFVVVGPLLTVWLQAHALTPIHRGLDGGGLTRFAAASLAIQACSVAFGICAGMRLWRVRPGAVATARQSLLFGLAADMLCTALDMTTADGSSVLGPWHGDYSWRMVPQWVFFTVCYAYLNRSARVRATWDPSV